MIICAVRIFVLLATEISPIIPLGGKTWKKASRDFEQTLACELYASRPQPSTLKNLWNRAVVCIKSVVCLFFACTLPHEFLSFAFIFFLNLCLSSFASIVYAMTFWANYFFFMWTLSSLCARRTKQKESQEFVVIADFLKL